MNLFEELNNLSNSIANYKDNVKGEQATINAFILPFIRILGYDHANPTEVVPQFTADIGTKKGEKIDLAILKNENVIMLIECKKSGADISKADVSQLYRYFTAVTEARIGVLTNGVQYRFYTDSEKPNVMDTEPFFEFTMSEIHQPLADVLNDFTKDNFDLDNTRSKAIDLKHRSEIKQILVKQLETPNIGFVDFFRDTITTQMGEKDFTDVVKRAFNEFLDEQNKKETIGNDEQNKKESNGNDEQIEEEHKGNDEQNGKSGGLAKPTNLRVTMPDKTVIHHYNGKQTYIEVLEKLELEKVMQVRPKIVSKEPFPLKDKGVKHGEFWIRVITGFGTKGRKEELEKIAGLLGVELIVERVEKKPKSS